VSATAAPSVRPTAPLDLARPHRLHVIGVGGPGMSAVAIALAEMGHRVSGSDIREQPVLDRVRAAGVDVMIGHGAQNVQGSDAVTASPAIPADNLERRAAEASGIPFVRRAGMLASICAQAQALAVAGTHGKTTTTSMLLLILADAGLKPNFVIGGDVTDMGTGAQWTGGDWLVVEADESDGTHLELPLYGTILTNIDVDHLDLYGSFDGIVAAFDRYLAQIDGPRVLCADDEACARLAAEHGAVSYGRSAKATYRITGSEALRGTASFSLGKGDDLLGRITLPLRGEHNMLNAAGAAAMALEIGVPFETVRGALERFGGVARRFDIRGMDGGATFVDDYAHLPAEIAAALAAAKHGGDGWRRVIAVFQPNRFHRVAEMWRDYANAFVDADLVVVTEIYASGTTPIPGVSGKLIVNAVTEAHPRVRVVWLPHRDDLVTFLAREVGDGDVCVSMGCGDVASLPDEVLSARHAGTVSRA